MVRPAAAALLLLLAAPAADTPDPEDWSRFRGPNGSGISVSTRVPAEFGPDRNVIWKTELPFGHSSPALTHDRIVLTAARGERLVTICLDRRSGRILIAQRRNAHRNGNARAILTHPHRVVMLDRDPPPQCLKNGLHL